MRVDEATSSGSWRRRRDLRQVVASNVSMDVVVYCRDEGVKQRQAGSARAAAVLSMVDSESRERSQRDGEAAKTESIAVGVMVLGR